MIPYCTEWHRSITLELIRASVAESEDELFFSLISVMSAKMKTAHCAGRRKRKLYIRVIFTAWYCHWRQAGTVRSAPHNWLGKDLAGRHLGDLYTSPGHPPPPALSARPLLSERIQTFVKTVLLV